jgi:hypothetical protein
MPYTPHHKRKPTKPKKPQEPKHDWFEKITLLTAIVGIVVITLTYVAIKGQLEEMRAATAIERPFLFVDGKSITIPAIGTFEPKPHLELTIRNAGRQTAVLSVLIFAIHVSRPNEHIPDLRTQSFGDFGEASGRGYNWLTIPIGGTLDLSCDRVKPFTVEETSRLRDESTSIFVIGKGVYASPTGAQYILTTLLSYDPELRQLIPFRAPSDLQPNEYQ